MPCVPRLLWLVAVCTVIGSAACASLSRRSDGAPSSVLRVTSTTVMVRGQPLELHLAAPVHPRAPDVLVVYASGDGGWFGAAVDMFRAVGEDGFYAVGVSSRTLLHRKLPNGQPPSVADLADDYRVIVERAGAVLGLPPQRRLVFTGWSRGASLAVLLGSAHHAPPNLAGIVAIGLGADENLGVASDTDEEPVAPRKHDGPSLDMYGLLAQVAPRRAAVIQSTGDGYLRASRARELFGPDTEQRRFHAVTARNHRFSGGTAAFGEALRASLDWVLGVSSRDQGSGIRDSGLGARGSGLGARDSGLGTRDQGSGIGDPSFTCYYGDQRGAIFVIEVVAFLAIPDPRSLIPSQSPPCTSNITSGTRRGSGTTWASRSLGTGDRRCWPSRPATATSGNCTGTA